MPRPYTTEEVRARFLAHVRNLVQYWAGIDLSHPDPARGDLRQRLDGLAFSMLVAIDGGSMGLPGFVLAPLPHPDDREFQNAEGSNWFPENHLIESQIASDISGCLHDQFYRPDEIIILLSPDPA